MLSEADSITKKNQGSVCFLDINVLDHLIITDESYFSLDDDEFYDPSPIQPRKPRKKPFFYIQSHGLHAGRLTKKPILNSWETPRIKRI
jgi:hypothetical protein